MWKLWDDVEVVATKNGGVPINDIGISTNAEECRSGLKGGATPAPDIGAGMASFPSAPQHSADTITLATRQTGVGPPPAPIPMVTM